MDRKIKFRGWFQGTNGQEFWVYGYLVKQANGNWEITNGETYWTVDNVGQFTGLKDKNEKDIYEGDIISLKKHKEPSNWASEKIHINNDFLVVGFLNGCFVTDIGKTLYESIKDIIHPYNFTDYEIIGNIYEKYIK